MLQALYGPVVPGLREEFGLSPSGAGLGLSLHFTGGVVGVLAFNAIHSRISNRALLAASYGLMAAGAAGFALAPDWPSRSAPLSSAASASAASTTASTSCSPSASATAPPPC